MKQKVRLRVYEIPENISEKEKKERIRK